MENKSKAIPEFLLKKTSIKKRIEFWPNRKDSSPSTIGDASRSKLINVDALEAKSTEKFHCTLNLRSQAELDDKSAAVDTRKKDARLERQAFQVGNDDQG